MKTNRVVGVADNSMHESSGPQRPLGARIMSKMKAKVFWWVGKNHLNVPLNAKNAPGNLRAAAFLRQNTKLLQLGKNRPVV